MPVPRTTMTEACTQYYEDGETINDEIREEIMANIAKLKKSWGKVWRVNNPLLVSVRSDRERPCQA